MRYLYDKGTGLIVMTDVQCEGSEVRLVDCLHNSNTSDCGHHEDVAVYCCKHNNSCDNKITIYKAS